MSRTTKARVKFDSLPTSWRVVLPALRLRRLYGRGCTVQAVVPSRPGGITVSVYARHEVVPKSPQVQAIRIADDANHSTLLSATMSVGSLGPFPVDLSSGRYL